MSETLDNALNNSESPKNDEASREEILKQIFGEIGELIDDFTCAVESTVLLHGRMYITNKFICFYSNLFGLEKKIRIPYSHIRSITKTMTAMVIPNAISISTDKKDYVFRSFWDREDCYRILSAFLIKFKGGVPPSSSSATPSSSSSDTNKHLSKTVNSATARPRSTSTEDVDHVFDTESGTEITSPIATVDMHAAFLDEAAKAVMKVPVIHNEILNISLKEFAALVIVENAPYNYKKYHESVKDTDVALGSWSEMSSSLGCTREMKFFKPVNLPGLASTRGVKLQRYKHYEDIGIILYSSTRLEDVPAADTFSVDDTLIIKQVDANSISVEISFQVNFVKNTMMKYIIESSTNKEMGKWLDALFQHFKKLVEIAKNGGGVGGSGSDSAAFTEEIGKVTCKIPVITGEVVNMSLKDFNKLIVAENAPYNYKRYHESVKDSQVVLDPWDTSVTPHTREMKFFKPVNLPGLASTRGVKIQKYQYFEDVGLYLYTSTRLQDVPAADCFTVEDVLIVKFVDANTVSVEISFHVHFVKNTMMKYIIESSTKTELAKWLDALFQHFKKLAQLNKEGKLDSAAADTAPTEAVVVAEPEAKKGGGGVIEGFMAILSFRNEAFGDQIKFFLVVLLAFYLIFNYMRWQMINIKVEELETQIKIIENLAKELLLKSTSATCSKN